MKRRTNLTFDMLAWLQRVAAQSVTSGLIDPLPPEI